MSAGEPPIQIEVEGQSARQRRPGRVARLVYRAIGALAMLLAAVGVVVPGLPATPFLLVALWAFSRGAPALAERLRTHPRYGPLVRNWEARRVIPRKAKGAAAVGMAGSWGVLAFTTENLILLGSVGACMVCVFAYVVTRPHE